VTFADGSTHIFKNAPANLTPEEVTERAERAFGKEVVHIDGGRSAPKSAAPQPATPNVSPSENAKLAIQELFPQARITDWKRDPKSDLGRANPNSWHNRSAAAVDIAPIPGMSFDEFKQQIEEAGYPIIQAIDEVNNPSGHATGPHWHVVIGQRQGDATPPPQDDEPSTVPADSVQSPSESSDALPPSVAPQQADDAGSFFRLPRDLDEWKKGLALGSGNVVEGLADIPGIVLDPINTMIGRGLGYDGYTADFGKTVRETLGLPEDNSLAGDVIRGATGGLGAAGMSRLASKAAQGLTARNALASLSSTPVRDTAGGAGAAFGAGLAEREGAPVPVQVAAGLAGGATSVLGLNKAMASGAKLADGPMGDRLVPKLAQDRFAARQALNKYRDLDRAISVDVNKIVQVVKEANSGNGGKASSSSKKLSRSQAAEIAKRLTTLEESYLPRDEIKALSIKASAKAKLRKALDNRHILDDADVDALRDGTPAGDAVAEAIHKARRLRSALTAEGPSGLPAMVAEGLGGLVGNKLGGPIGQSAGAMIARRLANSEAKTAAERAVELARQAPKFSKMPSETFGPSAQDALSKAASEAMDAPFLARKEAERLKAEGHAMGVQNAKDDIIPAGGYRGYLYAETGLKPSAQDAGALAALKDGKITPKQFDLFLNRPEALMEGKAGLHLRDRLAAMADAGSLERDPNWTKPEAPTAPVSPMVDAQGQPIRSLPAYQAGAAKNAARELELMRQLDEIDPIRGQLGDDGPAIRDSEIGSLSKADADRAAGIRAELAKLKQGKEGKRK
jgi:hypothetical protein